MVVTVVMMEAAAMVVSAVVAMEGQAFEVGLAARAALVAA